VPETHTPAVISTTRMVQALRNSDLTIDPVALRKPDNFPNFGAGNRRHVPGSRDKDGGAEGGDLQSGDAVLRARPITNRDTCRSGCQFKPIMPRAISVCTAVMPNLFRIEFISSSQSQVIAKRVSGYPRAEIEELRPKTGRQSGPMSVGRRRDCRPGDHQTSR
jgi:hypothetical protein